VDAGLLWGMLPLTCCGASGVFALPLFDGRLRHRNGGPALPTITVLASVLGPFALLLAVCLPFRALGDLVGLGVLIVGGVSGLIACGVGLLVTLVGAERAGAWVGAVGLLVGLGSLAFWHLAGAPRFPW